MRKTRLNSAGTGLYNLYHIKKEEFYETFRTPNEIYPKVESILRNDDWTKTYKSLHKGLCSELRSFNYRILFGALYTKDKFKFRNKKDMDCAYYAK